jgi:uncharacterized integral membrane protein
MSEFPKRPSLASHAGLALMICATGVFIGLPGTHPLILPALFLGCGLIAALAVQSRNLPLQNLAGAGATLFALSAVGDLLLTGVAGSWNSPAASHSDGTALSSSTALNAFFWTATVISARGAAARLLKRHRGKPFHGVWLILVGALLAGLTRVFWTSAASHPRAVSAALLLSNDSIDDPIILAVVSSFVPGTLFAMLLLVAATPWFINKHPAAADPDRNALFVWLLLAIALAASAMRGPT